jgi:hypothetical protein
VPPPTIPACVPTSMVVVSQESPTAVNGYRLRIVTQGTICPP